MLIKQWKEVRISDWTKTPLDKKVSKLLFLFYQNKTQNKFVLS